MIIDARKEMCLLGRDEAQARDIDHEEYVEIIREKTRCTEENDFYHAKETDEQR